jgi:hypothetical protein
MSATKKNVDWLVRLGFEDRAREAYLLARTATIAKRLRYVYSALQSDFNANTLNRQCTFEGNLPAYIYQLSFIYFTSMKDTVQIYQACFPMSMMSACVKWAKEHVDAFNALLGRQLSSTETGGEVYRECMGIALAHADMLGEAGVDFRSLIGVKVDSED